MIVLNVSVCPIGLRGNLTKWLIEISPGVFVGQVSTRVRDELWKHVEKECRNGNATLVYNTNSAQRLDFRVHGDVWEPIDFDGIKLMLRPSPSRLKGHQSTTTHGFSNAAKHRNVKRFAGSGGYYPANYIVTTMRTTGLNNETDEIIELGAIKVVEHEIMTEEFKTLIRISENIGQIVGHPTSNIEDETKKMTNPLSDALVNFCTFLGNMPIVTSNSEIYLGFLLHGCTKCAIPLIMNRCIDIQGLAQRIMPDLSSYTLDAIASRFDIAYDTGGCTIDDCKTIKQSYEKLIKLINTRP